MSNSFSNVFLDGSKPIITRTYQVNEDDYVLVAKVFAERGGISNLPGYLIKQVAEYLRSNDISSFENRKSDIPTLLRKMTLKQKATNVKPS
jgi:hypothetical protein